MHCSEFNTLAALAELYSYAFKYSDQLMLALEEDEFSNKQRLAYKLEQVNTTLTKVVALFIHTLFIRVYYLSIILKGEDSYVLMP